MSSFNADKKREHEKAAEKALANNDYAKAFFHTTQAAEFTYNLAEQSDGDLAYAYLDDANELVAIATQLKEKIKSVSSEQKPLLSSSSADKAKDSEMLMDLLPRERLSDISGMEEAKEFVLNNVIVPISDPQKADIYDLDTGGGILLYGLPGTGKTFFARAVAGELGLPFYVLDTSKIMNKYVGDSQKAIKELFDTARANPMSVIFIDETNGVMPARNQSNVHETTNQVQNIILQEIDGIDSKEKNPFLLIGATNYPGNLDDAALSRFSKRIEVPLPNGETRRFILEREIMRMKLRFEKEAFDFLEEKTEGFSCRDIVLCAKNLKSSASSQNITEFTLEFCKQNFVDNHVISVEVSESIAEFKKRIGEQESSKKK